MLVIKTQIRTAPLQRSSYQRMYRYLWMTKEKDVNGVDLCLPHAVQMSHPLFAPQLQKYKDSGTIISTLTLNQLIASSYFPPFQFHTRRNNTPPPSRKTSVPFENSITRLHKRLKIIVLSLYGGRGSTWQSQHRLPLNCSHKLEMLH